MAYLVVDNPFNRANYAEFVGKVFDDPPAYAHVIDEAEELNTMSNEELVAYWNILQANNRAICSDPERNKRHITIVSRLLTMRHIPHEHGKRTVLR